MRDIYYAKTINRQPDIPVEQHLLDCREYGMKYGAAVGIPIIAGKTLLCHDIGKISDLFQQALAGNVHNIDHAIASAALMYKQAPRAMVECIAAHHSKLLPISRLRPFFKHILDGTSQDSPSGKQSAFRGKDGMQTVVQYLQGRIPEYMYELDVNDYETPDGNDKCSEAWKSALSRFVFTKLLLSCQADADYSVSAYEEMKCLGEPDNKAVLADLSSPIDAVRAIKTLTAMRDDVIAASTASDDIKRLREMVWQDCLAAGQGSVAYMTLTAPTGSAKTFGLIRLALERVYQKKARRIIFVLPYLSLTEQVAGIMKTIIPETVVDTSVAELDDDQRLQAEKWNAPCIITTAVQFFDSLFSDRPGASRKLHSLGESVIIFDEIQSLRHELSRIAMQSLYFLQNRYHATIVLSTATQPAFQMIPGLDWGASEIISDIPACFAMTPAKPVDFRLTPIELTALAIEASEYDNVCVICNLKRHAREVYDQWAAMGLSDIYCLSADLCPADRARMIQEIKRKQDEGRSVHVAATQCIEAGVDLDFRKMFRALAPLAALVQALGRMDRNGRWPGETFTVFVPASKGWLYPDAGYEQQASLVRILFNAGIDLFSQDGIREYYKRLFEQFREPEKLTDALKSMDYPEITKQAKMIPKTGYTVIVPCASEKMLFDSIYARVFSDTDTIRYTDIARAGRISVTSYDNAGILSHCRELVVRRRSRELHTGTYILLEGHEGCYSPETGLAFQDVDYSC